ncbi:immediate early response gene 2 protein [Tachysurus ichikawai]
MEVCAEAKRVMVQALSKMYSYRNQRGGIPLHRSLLLTLVMRSARDTYHSVRVQNHGPDTTGQSDSSRQELMDTTEVSDPPLTLQGGERILTQDNTVDKENCNSTRHHPQSRKRKGKSATEPDFLPYKKARLDITGLRRVLLDSTTRSNTGNCARDTGHLTDTHIPRTIVTF